MQTLELPAGELDDETREFIWRQATTPTMCADTIWLKTYTPRGDGTSDEHLIELHEALKPEIAARLQRGGAFQLVFWGQGCLPRLVPQARAPEQSLGTAATASGNAPSPYSRTTSTPSVTDLPETGQA